MRLLAEFAAHFRLASNLYDDYSLGMELDEKARDALRVIYRRGILRGKDVQRLAGIDNAAQLSTILRTLENNKFITLQRGASSESDQGTLDAFVAPLPSGRAQGEYEISKAK